MVPMLVSVGHKNISCVMQNERWKRCRKQQMTSLCITLQHSGKPRELKPATFRKVVSSINLAYKKIKNNRYSKSNVQNFIAINQKSNEEYEKLNAIANAASFNGLGNLNEMSYKEVHQWLIIFRFM